MERLISGYSTCFLLWNAIFTTPPTVVMYPSINWNSSRRIFWNLYHVMFIPSVLLEKPFFFFLPQANSASVPGWSPKKRGLEPLPKATVLILCCLFPWIRCLLIVVTLFIEPPSHCWVLFLNILIVMFQHIVFHQDSNLLQKGAV